MLIVLRVGYEVPGVVVWPLLFTDGLGGKCSDIRYDKATIKLLYNPRPIRRHEVVLLIDFND